MSDSQAIAAMIASRICHDLISPLGAISNGAELLALTSPGPPSPELDLITDCVHSAVSRTRFMRMAFGYAPESQAIGEKTLSDLVRDWSGAGRIKVDWRVRGDCSRQTARRGLLTLLCLETFLGFGGSLSVRQVQGGWKFVGEAARLQVLPNLLAMLTERQADGEITPSRIQFGLLREDLLLHGQLASGWLGETAFELFVPEV